MAVTIANFKARSLEQGKLCLFVLPEYLRFQVYPMTFLSF
jgi:hypothetical protein